MLPAFFFCIPLVSSAQFQWAHQIGSTGSEKVQKHVLDPQGNIIVTGYFENSVSIGEFELTSMDETDIFVYKTSPDGNVLWAKSFEGPVYGGDVGVDTDADGNVYIAGGFIEKLYFNGELKLSSVPDNRYWNSFMAKLDADGNMIWIKGILGTEQLSEVRVWGLISVNKEGIALAGNFAVGLMIGNQVLSNPIGFPGNNLFIAKFDLDGNLAWIKNPPSETNVECRKISLEDSGDIYLTGPFTNTVHFDSFTITATSSTHGDIYLAKLNSSGLTQWVKAGVKVTSRTDNILGQSFTIDPDGNVYLIGHLKGDVRFDQIVLNGNTEQGYSITDAFIVKYSKDGEVLLAVLFGKPFNAFLTDIEYSSTGTFLLGMATTSFQFFYINLNTEQLTGEPVFLEGYGIPWHISLSPDSTIFISGEMNILTTNQNELTTKGNYDGFVARVGACKNGDLISAPDLVGPGEFCLNSRISYAFAPVENAAQYVWEIPSFLNPEEEVDSNTTRVDLSVTSSGTGVVIVYGVNECGKNGLKAVIQVRALESPAKPAIEKSECETEIIVRDSETVEWYKNNELIPDESLKVLTISESGLYYVINRNYCGSTKSDVVSMDPVSLNKLFLTNIITPNGDGKNDSFQLPESVLNSELTIYNEWGMEVFRKRPYDNSWNANNLSGGIYYYSLQNQCFQHLYKGWIEVIKGNE